MREILFRGKRVDNGEWLYGCYYHCIGTAYGATFIVVNDFGFIEVIPHTVGQYTGLTDKNGVKIFEGDIIKSKHTIYGLTSEEQRRPRFCYDYEKRQEPYLFGRNIVYYRNYEVQFYKGRYRIINKNITHYIDTNFIYNHELEVIGNIHDNPKLLKGETNNE